MEMIHAKASAFIKNKNKQLLAKVNLKVNLTLMAKKNQGELFVKKVHFLIW